MATEIKGIDRLKEAARVLFRKNVRSTEVGAGISLQRPVAPEAEEYDRISIREDRRSVITDCITMEKQDPRIDRLYYKMASDATVGGFTAKVDASPTESIKAQAQLVIDQVIDDCEIMDKQRGWMVNALREGDTFLENIVDDKAKKIIRLKKMATIITMSNMDATGNFPKDKPAYYQEHIWTRQPIKNFEPWQVTQISWKFEDGNPYGCPLFRSSRRTQKMSDKGMENIAIRRSIVSGNRTQHRVGNKDSPGSWEDVDTYKKNNKDTLANPMKPHQNYYTTGNIEITKIGEDTTIGDIDDIEYIEGVMILPSGVPMALLGGGREKDVNRDVLKDQTQDYYRVVDDISEVFEKAYRRTFRFALLLAGINDEAITITFNWGSKDREETDAKLDRAIKAQTLGVSFETCFGIMDLDGVTYEEELDRIRSQVEEGIIPYGVGMKLDPNVLLALVATGRAGENTKVEELVSHVAKIKDLAESSMIGGTMREDVLALSSKTRKAR